MSRVGAAVECARCGVLVIPCHPKKPLTEHGLHDATANVDVLRGWWARWPDANVGLRTGITFDVLDIDPGGHEHIAGRELPDAPRARTPRGGEHVYLRATGHGNRAGLLPNVDYRGRGGYVLAPPSVGANGRPYEWTRPPRWFAWGSFPPAPGWLVELLDPPKPTRPVVTDQGGDNRGRPYALVVLRNRAAELERIPAGKRNHELFRAAARCAQLPALAADEIDAVLSAAAASAGLGGAETRATIRSGIRAGRNQ